MIDLSPFRKNKINLKDYDYQFDIKNRIILSKLSQQDLNVLEEILYNPVEFPIKKILTNLDLSVEELQPSLERLGETGLFTLDGDKIVVNKDIRKYFETQIVKYEEDFEPDMEFLQNLLKKVPIHVLPTWYQIPRTSNNIFESLLEKYFLTPQIFQRYLLDLNFGDDKLTAIVKDVFESEELAIPSETIMREYHLTREQFEECMLHLEFNFVCCLAMKKMGSNWCEVVTPFHEWRQYLSFTRDSVPKSISDTQNIVKRRPHDFSFIEDMSELVKLNREGPIAITSKNGRLTLSKEFKQKFISSVPTFHPSVDADAYIAALINKLALLNLASVEGGTLYPLEEAHFWSSLSTEKKALASYKDHYVALLTGASHSSKLLNERNLRELEKGLSDCLDLGWIYFEEFMKGVTIPLSETSKVELKKAGRKWKYTLPAYTDDEKALIEKIVLEWLFEAGMIAIGHHGDKLCFTLTPLGRKVFTR